MTDNRNYFIHQNHRTMKENQENKHTLEELQTAQREGRTIQAAKKARPKTAYFDMSVDRMSEDHYQKLLETHYFKIKPEEEEIQPMTWREMKEFVSTMTEEELNENVILWREEEAITSISAYRLDQDYYSDPEYHITDEGLLPKSEVEWNIKHNSEGEYEMKDFNLVHKQGKPILEENF